MRLHNFCWKKVQIGDDKVEAKKIMLYAAMRSSIENEIFLDIGYYWQLPTCREILNLNDAIVLHERPFVFFREGQLPLTIILNKVVPPIWKYNEETNAKKISFRTVAITYGCFLPFTLEKGVSDKTDGCACSFQAGQGPYLVDLMFSLKESSLSRNEATIPSTGNATAGDTHKELPSAIVKTEEIAVSDESLQVTSADEVSIRTGENTKKDECDSHFIRTESMIGNAGGTLRIQNTGVSLEIPPGALRRDYLIQIRIIPHHYLDETDLSFASNSSVVVELLPNSVKLSKPATLTLPHCLVLKKKCEWSATVYSSHHGEGNQRQWKEERNTQCELTHETCVIRLYNFCWKKVQIGDDIVEAKRIMLYASMRSSIENEIFLDIGYYWQLPRCREILNLNDAVVLHERPAMFFKEGQLPLTITLNKVVPPIWKYNEETNAKIISFTTVVFNEGDFCTFNLKKRGLRRNRRMCMFLQSWPRVVSCGINVLTEGIQFVKS
ncbi:uncharacterized protein [Apostichopus japonicus]|uniref:uncharacterized protein n=1 Tax=Stichopus japonicus TaxID=307972 RepID=UPI003AB87D04